MSPEAKEISSKILPFYSVASEKTLENVLGYLEKNDELFHYLVPLEMRDPAREGLQAFLMKTYLKDYLEVIGEDAVKWYIKPYDFIEFVGPDPVFQYKFFLEPGMKGTIQKIDLSAEYPLTVWWESTNHCPEKRLRHDGDDVFLLPDTLFGSRIGNKEDILAKAEVGNQVEPKAVMAEYLFYLPVGIRGIVTGTDSLSKYPVSIIFGNTEGYVPPLNGIVNCAYEGVKLLRENRIDIRKLFKEL